MMLSKINVALCFQNLERINAIFMHNQRIGSFMVVKLMDEILNNNTCMLYTNV